MGLRVHWDRRPPAIGGGGERMARTPTLPENEIVTSRYKKLPAILRIGLRDGGKD